MAYEHCIAVVRRPASDGYMRIYATACNLYNLTGTPCGNVWENAERLVDGEYIFLDRDRKTYSDSYNEAFRILPAKEFRVALEKTKRKCDPEGGAAWDLFKHLCATVENYPDEYILIGWGE